MENLISRVIVAVFLSSRYVLGTMRVLWKKACSFVLRSRLISGAWRQVRICVSFQAWMSNASRSLRRV